MASWGEQTDKVADIIARLEPGETMKRAEIIRQVAQELGLALSEIRPATIQSALSEGKKAGRYQNPGHGQWGPA